MKAKKPCHFIFLLKKERFLNKEQPYANTAESTFLKRGCYNVIHKKPGESTTQTMYTNHSWRPSQSDIMCHVCSRPNHLIGYEAVKVKQTITSNITHYGVSLFS